MEEMLVILSCSKKRIRLRNSLGWSGGLDSAMWELLSKDDFHSEGVTDSTHHCTNIGMSTFQYSMEQGMSVVI